VECKASAPAPYDEGRAIEADCALDIDQSTDKLGYVQAAEQLDLEALKSRHIVSGPVGNVVHPARRGCCEEARRLLMRQ
jgi:hypothetical protein